MQNEHPLTTWRKAENLTQDDLAIKLGVSRWMVNRLEAGERVPSFRLLMKIQSLCGDAVAAKDFERKAVSA